MDKLLITKTSSPEEISEAIKVLREQKGKEKETLKLIDEALSFGHSFVVDLFFEEALTHQHLYMVDQSNKKAIIDMEKSILKASFYVNKYKLTVWNSRLFRYMGRVADYRGQYKKAIDYYKRSLFIHKKSIKFVNLDPEPFRKFELEAFLSFSLIMSGQYEKGYKLAKITYDKFINSADGKLLKKKHKETWTIWMSGITIRTVNALIDKKLHINLGEIQKWLTDTEKYLNIKDGFSYRKMEIEKLWTKLQNSKNT